MADVLTRWRERCERANIENTSGAYGETAAVDRTKSCFHPEHAIKVLETTPVTLLKSYEKEGFARALTWLREALDAE